MKVLLIAYHFFPDPAVGALRSGRVARTLAERGHDVHVLSGPFGNEPATKKTDGMTIERLEPSLDPRALYTRLVRRARRPSVEVAPQESRADGAWTLPTHTPVWKRHVVALMWLPDDRQGWMAAAVRRGRALAAGQIDLIYTTAPPFSAHLAGLVLRRRLKNVRWIAEFRDPWTDNPFKPSSGRTRWSDAANRWLERACLKRADHIICVAESVAELLGERLGSSGGKVEIVRNGIEGWIRGSGPPSPGNGHILYAGNLYHSRDPTPFLRGLAALASTGGLPQGTVIDFVGDCSHFQGVDIRAFAADLGIEHLVNIRGAVPHGVSLRMMSEASVLLLLAQNQPLQVPNKLYEYLGARRPILAFADRGGESARMLGQVGGHTVLDSADPAAVRQAILAALNTRLDPSGRVDDLLEEWGTVRQFSRLTGIVEKGGQSDPIRAPGAADDESNRFSGEGGGVKRR